MIREALDYLAKIQTPKNPIVIDVRGEPFAVKPDGTLGDYIERPNPSAARTPLEVGTLSGLIAAYNAKLDGLDPAKVVIQVSNHVLVSIIDLAADEYGERRQYLCARHPAETNFQFDQFYLPEEFIIKFRAGFLFTDDAVKVQQLCSTLESGSTVSVADDGISQTVVISTGTINKTPVHLPAEGIPLIPWRTFREVAPVESKFLLRMKTVKDSLPRIALFEIDQKWRLDTIGAIRDYLQENLPGAIVIA